MMAARCENAERVYIGVPLPVLHFRISEGTSPAATGREIVEEEMARVGEFPSAVGFPSAVA